MAKLDGGEPYGTCSLGGHEYAACFSFRNQRYDVLYHVAHDVYGCIVHCVGMFGGVVTDDVPGGGSRICFL